MEMITAESVSASERGPWYALLHDAGLLHLEKCLEATLSLEGAYEALDVGRLDFLKKLRQAGVQVLKDRQALCNALARARRLAELDRERAARAEKA